MSSQKIRVLSREDVKKALSMKQAINLMKDAFVQLSTGQAVVPVRMKMEMPQANGRALFMPVYLPNTNKFGVKIVSIIDENPAQGLPLIHAMVMVFDSTNGRPLALMDGEYLTALRTGAAAGLATDLLAREDSKVAAIFGAGVQGRTQLEAVCTVRKIVQAYIFDIDPQKTAEFAQELSERLSVPVEMAKTSGLLSQADVICTATTSNHPVFFHNDLKSGVHINGVGSYTPNMCEIPKETIQQAKVVVDQREACLTEAGDLIQPLNQGLIQEDHIYAEIGEIAAGLKKGRESDYEITFFKSVGNAVQDLAAASQVLMNAEEMNLGAEIAL